MTWYKTSRHGIARIVDRIREGRGESDAMVELPDEQQGIDFDVDRLAGEEVESERQSSL